MPPASASPPYLAQFLLLQLPQAFHILGEVLILFLASLGSLALPPLGLCGQHGKGGEVAPSSARTGQGDQGGHALARRKIRFAFRLQDLFPGEEISKTRALVRRKPVILVGLDTSRDPSQNLLGHTVFKGAPGTAWGSGLEDEGDPCV